MSILVKMECENKGNYKYCKGERASCFINNIQVCLRCFNHIKKKHKKCKEVIK